MVPPVLDDKEWAGLTYETRFSTIDFHGEKVKVTYGVLIPNDNSFCYVKQINDKNYAVLKRGLLCLDCNNNNLFHRVFLLK